LKFYIEFQKDKVRYLSRKGGQTELADLLLAANHGSSIKMCIQASDPVATAPYAAEKVAANKTGDVPINTQFAVKTTAAVEKEIPVAVVAGKETLEKMAAEKEAEMMANRLAGETAAENVAVEKAVVEKYSKSATTSANPSVAADSTSPSEVSAASPSKVNVATDSASPSKVNVATNSASPSMVTVATDTLSPPSNVTVAADNVSPSKVNVAADNLSPSNVNVAANTGTATSYPAKVNANVGVASHAKGKVAADTALMPTGTNDKMVTDIVPNASVDLAVRSLSDASVSGVAKTASTAAVCKALDTGSTASTSTHIEQGTVIHVNNPEDFYVTSVASHEAYEAILKDAQDTAGQPLPLPPHPGQLCLVEDGGVSQRARVEKISPDGSQAKVFLLDEGRRCKVPVSLLQRLDPGLEQPGLARQVALAGLQMGPAGWTEEMLDHFISLVDMENELVFNICTMGRDARGVERVRMEDNEGNDLTLLCIDGGIGLADNTGTGKYLDTYLPRFYYFLKITGTSYDQ
jgi:Tudor domain